VLQRLEGGRATGLAGGVELVELEQADALCPRLDDEVRVSPRCLGGVRATEQ
jgi:hypothetical protein